MSAITRAIHGRNTHDDGPWVNCLELETVFGHHIQVNHDGLVLCLSECDKPGCTHAQPGHRFCSAVMEHSPERAALSGYLREGSWGYGSSALRIAVTAGMKLTSLKIETALEPHVDNPLTLSILASDLLRDMELAASIYIPPFNHSSFFRGTVARRHASSLREKVAALGLPLGDIG